MIDIHKPPYDALSSASQHTAWDALERASYLLIFILALGASAGTITDFTPGSGVVGTSVDITGTALGVADSAEIIVRFGDIEASVTARSDTALTVIVPVGAKTSRISVQTSAGRVDAGRVFDVLVPISGSVSLPGGLLPADFALVSSQADGSLTGASYTVGVSDTDCSILSCVEMADGKDRIFFAMHEPGSAAPTISARTTAEGLILQQPFFITDDPTRVAALMDILADPAHTALQAAIDDLESTVTSSWVSLDKPLDDATVTAKIKTATVALLDALPSDSYLSLSGGGRAGRDIPFDTDWLDVEYTDTTPPKIFVRAPDGNPVDWWLQVAKLDDTHSNFDAGLSSILALESKGFVRDPSFVSSGVIPSSQISAKIDIVDYAILAFDQAVRVKEKPIELPSGDGLYIVRAYSGALRDSSPGAADSALIDAIDAATSGSASSDAASALALNVMMITIDLMHLTDWTGLKNSVGAGTADAIRTAMIAIRPGVESRASAFLAVLDANSGMSDAARAEAFVGMVVAAWQDLPVSDIAANETRRQVGNAVKKLWQPLEVLARISLVGKVGERTAGLLGASLGPNVTPIESAFVVIGDPFAPKITGGSALEAFPGEMVTFTAARWDSTPGANSIFIGTSTLTGEALVGTELSVTLPEPMKPGIYKLAAESPRGGPRDSGLFFTVKRKPIVANITPAKGFGATTTAPFETYAGTEITITGQYFAAGDTVTIGGVAAPVTHTSANVMRVTVPALAAGDHDLIVAATDSAGTSEPISFTALAPPAFSAVVPAEAKGNALLTLSCANLSDVTAEAVVRFTFVSRATIDSPPLTLTPGGLTVRLPAGISEGASVGISVLTPAGVSLSHEVIRLPGLTPGATLTVTDRDTVAEGKDGILNLADALLYASMAGDFLTSPDVDDDNIYQEAIYLWDAGDERYEFSHNLALTPGQVADESLPLRAPDGGKESRFSRDRRIGNGPDIVGTFAAIEDLDPAGSEEDGDLGFATVGALFADTIVIDAAATAHTPTIEPFLGLGAYDKLEGPAGGSITLIGTAITLGGKGAEIRRIHLKGGGLSFISAIGCTADVKVTDVTIGSGNGIELGGGSIGNAITAEVTGCTIGDGVGLAIGAGASANDITLISGGNTIGLRLVDTTKNSVTAHLGYADATTATTNPNTGVDLFMIDNANDNSISGRIFSNAHDAVSVIDSGDNRFSFSSITCAETSRGFFLGPGVARAEDNTADNVITIGRLTGSSVDGLVLQGARDTIIQDTTIDSCDGEGITLIGASNPRTIIRRCTLGGPGIANLGFGIAVSEAMDTQIDDCEILANVAGGIHISAVGAPGESPTLIRRTTVSGPSDGSAIMLSAGTSNCIIENCRTEGHAHGILLADAGTVENRAYNRDDPDASALEFEPLIDCTTGSAIWCDGASANAFGPLIIGGGENSILVSGGDSNRFFDCTMIGSDSVDIGANLIGTSDCELRNCELRDHKAASARIIGCTAATFNGVSCKDSSGDGIIVGDSDGTRLGLMREGGGLSITGFKGAGIDITGGNGVGIFNATINGGATGLAGIVAGGDLDGMRVGNIAAFGNVSIDGCSETGVRIDGSGGARDIEVAYTTIGATTPVGVGYHLMSTTDTTIGPRLGPDAITPTIGGLACEGSHTNLKIQKLAISGASDFGMAFAAGAANCEVRNCQLTNNQDGIELFGGAVDNSFTANLIRGNTRHGILADETATKRNRYSGNTIYRNGSAGIAITGGSQNGIEAPEITEVNYDRGRVQGSIDGDLPDGSVVHVFADSADEGEIFLGMDTPKNNRFTVYGDIPPGMKPNAIVVDPDGNTSEFGSLAGLTVRSGQPNTIVFTSTRTGNEDIFLLVAGETNPQQITTDPGADWRPRLAPNGIDIAWASDRGLMRFSAAGIETLLADSVSGPAWSPSGRFLLYVSDGDIKVYEIGTGASATIGSGSQPAWSPDGARIAYVSGGDIYTANADGSGAVMLAAGLSPAWSIDSSKILYSSGGDLFEQSLVARAPTQLTDDAFLNFDPVYADSAILFDSDRGDGLEIYQLSGARLTLSDGVNVEADAGMPLLVAGTLRGTVSSGGVPVAGHVLTSSAGQTATTNPAGEYIFREHPTGSHSLNGVSVAISANATTVQDFSITDSDTTDDTPIFVSEGGSYRFRLLGTGAVFRWFVDDVLVPGADSAIFDYSPDFDVVAHPASSAPVRVRGEIDTSSGVTWTAVTVRDTDRAPSAPGTDIDPAFPVTTDDISIAITDPAVDPDGDAVSYHTTWEIIGVASRAAIEGPTLSAANTQKGYTIRATTSPVTNPYGLFNSIGTATDVIEFTIANSAPVANDASLGTPLNTDLAVFPAAYDPDGDAISFSIGTPAHGSVIAPDPANGRFTYRPDVGFSGDDVFTFTVSDGELSSVGTITITVDPDPGPPLAVDDSFTGPEDSSLTGNVLANDVAADGPFPIVTAYTQPASGSVTVTATGIFSYVPNPDFFGPDSFSYTIITRELRSVSAAVHLSITNVDDLPTTVADSATTDEDTSFVFDLLANDEDIDSPLTLVSWTSPNYDGMTYTPMADFHGQETFVYEVNDGVTGVATVTVRAINDLPVNTALPVITGIAAVGETVGVTPGIWNDDEDVNPGSIALSYQWLRDGADILGAVGSSYTLVAADIGTALSVRETATNTGEGTPVTVIASVESAPRASGWRVRLGTPARAGSVTFGMSSGASVGADAFDTADNTPPLTLHNLGLTLSADWRPLADSATWLLRTDSFSELVLNFTTSALPAGRYLSIYEVRGAFDFEPTGATATRLEGGGILTIPPGPRWFLIRYGDSLSSIYTLRTGYNLISFPYQPDGNARGIFIQEGQHIDLGDLTYVFGGEDRLAGQVEAYRGYWLFTPRREIVRVEGIPAPRTLTIAPGWNSVGVDVELGPGWTLRSRLHFWSYGYRKTNHLSPQRGYLADFADSELTW